MSRQQQSTPPTPPPAGPQPSPIPAQRVNSTMHLPAPGIFTPGMMSPALGPGKFLSS